MTNLVSSHNRFQTITAACMAIRSKILLMLRVLTAALSMDKKILTYANGFAKSHINITGSTMNDNHSPRVQNPWKE